jgi:hypothetical protein
MTFTSLNEDATLEWLDTEPCVIRFRYSNRFYGSCTFKARLDRNLLSWNLNRESLTVENCENLKIAPTALVELSTVCLRRVLLKCSKSAGSASSKS